MKRVRKATIFVVVIAVLWAGFAHVNGYWPFARNDASAVPQTSYDVNSDGGTFTFPDGIVVTVPKGAVTQKTTLSVGDVTPLNAQDKGPFDDDASKGIRAGGIKLDVSLSRGDQRNIQPVRGKPLGITIPLRGKLRPTGVDTRLALLYTPGVNGKGYQLVPTQPVQNDILRGTLQHLSPKYVTYVSDQGLLDSFFPEKVEDDRGACKQEVSVKGAKVKIGAKKRGWSLDDNSPIFACLSDGGDGHVRVGIANRLFFILSAAATDDVRLVSSVGDPEEEVAKRLSDLLFPNDKIKAYVGRDGKLVGSVGVDALPATVELRGDPNTFLAEGAWQAIKLLAGIITGSNSGDIATTVLDAPAVIGCIQNALDIDRDNLPSIAGIIDLVASKCTESIVGALQPHIDPFNLLGRAHAIFTAAWDVVKVTRTAFDGIRMTFNGTVRVPVVAEADTPVCPTGSVLDRLVMQPTPPPGVRVLEFNNRIEICHHDWAVGGSQIVDTSSQASVVPFVLQRTAGAWRLAYEGHEPGYSPPCQDASLPGDIREWLGCND